MSDHADTVVVAPFAEPHAHVDRAFSTAVTGFNRSGTLAEAIDRFLGSLDRMTAESLSPGATRALRLLEEAGVAHVRTHTAVGGTLGFRAWEAVERAAAAVPGVEVRQVAMAITPNLDHPEPRSWLREAAARGAVAIGGAPWHADDPAAAVRAAAALAAEAGLDLDLHMDETDDHAVCTLPALAAAVEEHGLGGRAVAAHCCSLAGRPVDIARHEAELLAAAGVAVVVCPVSNLSLQGRQLGVRGVAPVRLLREASVTVGIGVDNLRDVVVAVGTPDPLRAAWLLAIVGHLTTEEDLEWLGRVVTAGNRRIVGLDPDPGPGEGQLVIESGTLAEAVALVPPRWRKGGRR